MHVDLPLGERLRFAMLTARPIPETVSQKFFDRYFAYSVLTRSEVPVVSLLPKMRTPLSRSAVKKTWPRVKNELARTRPHVVLACGPETMWSLISLNRVMPDILTEDFSEDAKLRGGRLTRAGGAFRAMLGKAFQTRAWKDVVGLMPVLGPGQVIKLGKRKGPDHSALIYINRMQSFPGQFYPIRYYRKFRTRETTHYTVHYPASSFASRNIRRLLKEKEEQYKWMLRELGLRRPGFRITYYLMNSIRDMERFTGYAWEGRGNIWRREIYRVHTKLRPGFTSPHEDVHVLEARESYAVFLSEGMAQHLSSKWFEYDDDKWLRYFIKEFHVPLLAQLLDLEFFLGSRGYPTQVAFMYNLAEHFVEFFVDRYGVRAYHLLMAASNRDELFADIRRVTGRTVSRLDREWRRTFPE